MKKHEKILKSYRLNHKGDNLEDVERTKISRERAHSDRLQKKAQGCISGMLSGEDPDGILDRYDEMIHAAKKEAGNSSTHKKRLCELTKNEEFS